MEFTMEERQAQVRYLLISNCLQFCATGADGDQLKASFCRCRAKFGEDFIQGIKGGVIKILEHQHTIGMSFTKERLKDLMEL